MLEDLRLVLQDLEKPPGFIDSYLKSLSKKMYNSHWRSYKRWCHTQGLHPWVSASPSAVTKLSAVNRVMEYLSFINFQIGEHPAIKSWMRGWSIEKPAKPRYDPDEDGWDIGLIVEYWANQPTNDKLNLRELTLKVNSLFAVTVYPRPSDSAQLARDQTVFLATAMKYRFFGAKELRAVPKFTKVRAVLASTCEKIDLVKTMFDYRNRTSGPNFHHRDLEHNYDHMFMSMVPGRDGKHFPVSASTCSRWMYWVMKRVSIDPKYKGGSVRMAAASAAIDRGTPIEVVLSTGRWTSWRVFQLFYNRARLRDIPAVGRTEVI